MPAAAPSTPGGCRPARGYPAPLARCLRGKAAFSLTALILIAMAVVGCTSPPATEEDAWRQLQDELRTRTPIRVELTAPRFAETFTGQEARSFALLLAAAQFSAPNPTGGGFPPPGIFLRLLFADGSVVTAAQWRDGRFEIIQPPNRFVVWNPRLAVLVNLRGAVY